MCPDTDHALLQPGPCVPVHVEEDEATLSGPSCLACGGGWFSLTWLSEVGEHRLQSGPLSSLPGMLNLDHGPNPNSTEGGRGQVLGEALPSLVLSASS